MRGRCVEYCWAARPSAAGARGSAWRWRSEQSSGSATRVAAAEGCPRPEGGWAPGLGLPDRATEAGQGLAAVEASGVGAVGASGASEAGARRIVAALRGRAVAAVGRRWRPLRSGAVSLKAGVGSSGVLGLLVPRRSLIAGRLPGL